MDTLQLSLRQRKLLHTLQKQDSYMTGKELADLLHVSARTIRSDITEINYILAQHNAAILSTHSKGYLFQAKDPEKIKELNRIDTAFFTKEDRIHYLTQQLCLSDEPLNLFDLEDEIFISHTTLMYDLQIIKKRFSMNTPYIQIMLSKNEISFEKNEKKIRQILLSLAHENWDYTNRGNALYKFRFLNWDFIAFVAAKLPDLLCKYNIYMEDPTLVALELSLAIMYHRIQSGHTLPETDAFPMTDTAAYLICKALFSLLETQYHCTFPKSERDTVYLFISSMSIQNHAPAKKENIPFFFGPITIDTANSYLNKINALFQIDFSQDEDFYWTLLLYLRDLQTGHSIFTCQQNLHDFKTSLLGECEFAYIFQEFAPEYMGRRLTETELVNLAFLFSGALSYHLTLHPEKKLKAVLCCHEKLTTTWALKRKLLSRFQNYIDITALLPVHSKTTYDFSNTDLILTTIQKKFANAPMQKIILVDDRPSANFYDLDLPIQLIVMHSICPMPSCSIKQLFEHAYWHEQETFTERFPVIETLVSDLIKEGITSDVHLLDILSREATFTFSIEPGITFLYTLIPALETKLSIMTLKHRILWNEHKIRTIVLAVFRKEDINLLFHLKIFLYKTLYNTEILKNLKTREELLDYFFPIESPQTD